MIEKIESVNSRRFIALKNVAFDDYSKRHDHPALSFSQSDLQWLIKQAEKAHQVELILQCGDYSNEDKLDNIDFIFFDR